MIFPVFALLIPSFVLAQGYSIDWYQVASGGGTSKSGVYSVSGTIGQHDAGGLMTGGSYWRTSGFWARSSRWCKHPVRRCFMSAIRATQ